LGSGYETSPCRPYAAAHVFGHTGMYFISILVLYIAWKHELIEDQEASTATTWWPRAALLAMLKTI